MKKLATTFLLLALCATTASAANQVRISQVYGGGGSSSATTFNVDYVELFNSGGTAVNIGGWTIEYGSATGLWGSSAANIFTFPADTFIQPCSYILTAHGTPGAVGAPLAPAADFNGTLTISATSRQDRASSAPSTRTWPAAPSFRARWSTRSRSARRTAPRARTSRRLTNVQAAVRNGGGMIDTDNNLADFTVVLNATPRNSASAPNGECVATPAAPSSWGAVKSIYRN